VKHPMEGVTIGLGGHQASLAPKMKVARAAAGRGSSEFKARVNSCCCRRVKVTPGLKVALRYEGKTT
jgi:hypothetical protein